jgi:hypothetical protein
VFGAFVGTFVSFLMTLFSTGVPNQAGPDWMWAGGRNDFIRNLYFRQNGSFRRFGRVALLATLFAGTGALYWLLHRA